MFRNLIKLKKQPLLKTALFIGGGLTSYAMIVRHMNKKYFQEPNKGYDYTKCLASYKLHVKHHPYAIDLDPIDLQELTELGYIPTITSYSDSCNQAINHLKGLSDRTRNENSLNYSDFIIYDLKVTDKTITDPKAENKVDHLEKASLNKAVDLIKNSEAHVKCNLKHPDKKSEEYNSCLSFEKYKKLDINESLDISKNESCSYKFSHMRYPMPRCFAKVNYESWGEYYDHHATCDKTEHFLKNLKDREVHSLEIYRIYSPNLFKKCIRKEFETENSFSPEVGSQIISAVK